MLVLSTVRARSAPPLNTDEYWTGDVRPKNQDFEEFVCHCGRRPRQSHIDPVLVLPRWGHYNSRECYTKCARSAGVLSLTYSTVKCMWFPSRERYDHCTYCTVSTYSVTHVSFMQGGPLVRSSVRPRCHYQVHPKGKYTARAQRTQPAAVAR